jgi:hypothetical protein
MRKAFARGLGGSNAGVLFEEFVNTLFAVVDSVVHTLAAITVRTDLRGAVCVW